MKVAIVVIAAVVTSGCFLAPSVEHVSQHTCFTQPRLYTTRDGRSQYEVDSYTQEVPCPAERIK